ncbi:MAG: hypothetical protein HY253_13460 [Burkholderiales bacterium]|nr:hypothetical protein [Burkholderiales bacterium]
MTQLLFSHEFEDRSTEGMLSIDTDATSSAKIRMTIDTEAGFWMSANREGWLHLARVAAELGLGKYDEGYHFHKDENFTWSTGSPEFTFERNDAL